MPTTIAVVSPDANARDRRSKFLAIMNEPDFIAIIIIAAIGLLAAIGLTIFLPLPDGIAAVVGQVS